VDAPTERIFLLGGKQINFNLAMQALLLIFLSSTGEIACAGLPKVKKNLTPHIGPSPYYLPPSIYPSSYRFDVFTARFLGVEDYSTFGATWSVPFLRSAGLERRGGSGILLFCEMKAREDAEYGRASLAQLLPLNLQITKIILLYGYSFIST